MNMSSSFSRLLRRASSPRSARRGTPRRSLPLLLRRRRGLSVVLIAIAIFALIGFVSLAVDIGRVKLAKAQLQTAADAAALAGAMSLKTLPGGVEETQDAAYDAAYKNFSIDTNDANGKREDHEVELVVEEDLVFGIWRDEPLEGQPHWTPLLEDNGGIDERRKANAIRAYGRRVTSFTDEFGDTYERGTGLPLIFAPVLPDGPLTGEIQASATARIRGGRMSSGFIGLEAVKFNGTTKTDSYNAATETYPGADGVPNQNSSISSNGNITLVGTTDIMGDVHPGVNGDILPTPLGGSVTVTGYMDPLSVPLEAGVDYDIPLYSPPSTNDNATLGTNWIRNGAFDPPGNQTYQIQGQPISADHPVGAQYVFTGWNTGNQQTVILDTTNGPINIWVNGDFKNAANATIAIQSQNTIKKVTFWINGNFNMQGGGIIQPPGSIPENLVVNVTKANTTVDIGGSPNVYMHLNAPLSDVRLHGNGTSDTLGFYGWVVGKKLTVLGNIEAHYDETGDSRELPYNIKMVR